MAELGRNLFTTLDKLQELLEKTPAGSDHDTLQAQYDRLWDQAQELIDANVQKATTEYNAAIKLLADANKKIQAAIDSLAETIEVINKVAEVIKVIATLLTKVGII
jgi:transcription elongation GreA/GreB family factor